MEHNIIENIKFVYKRSKINVLHNIKHLLLITLKIRKGGANRFKKCIKT